LRIHVSDVGREFSGENVQRERVTLHAVTSENADVPLAVGFKPLAVKVGLDRPLAAGFEEEEIRTMAVTNTPRVAGAQPW
jgi:hypothetical protein